MDLLKSLFDIETTIHLPNSTLIIAHAHLTTELLDIESRIKQLPSSCIVFRIFKEGVEEKVVMKIPHLFFTLHGTGV